jgi:hypothetical protein
VAVILAAQIIHNIKKKNFIVKLLDQKHNKIFWNVPRANVCENDFKKK